VPANLFFVSTVSFLFTAPGVSESGGLEVPSLSALGELLLKHVLMRGLSLWTLTDSIRAAVPVIAAAE
jgi:reactive chlorine resistance protein C